MLADAIMLGVILHQFTHWWEYARGDDKPVVRYIVVCPPRSFESKLMVVLLHDMQYRSYYIVGSQFCLLSLTNSMVVWIFHMFVYGFGDYTRFVEVSCMSPHSRSRLSCTDSELINRAIMVVLSRCRGPSTCPGESHGEKRPSLNSRDSSQRGLGQ